MIVQTKIEDSMTLKLVSERAEAELRLINSRELEQELANRDNHFNVRDIVAAALQKTDLIEAVIIRKIYEAIIKIDMKDLTKVENWAKEINCASQNPLAIESMKSKKKQAMPREEIIIPEMYIEKVRQETDSVDVVMNEKESRQDTSPEEKERQKRRKGKEVTDIEVINAKMEITTLNEIEEVKTKATEASFQQQNYKDIITAIKNEDDTRKIEEMQDMVP